MPIRERVNRRGEQMFQVAIAMTLACLAKFYSNISIFSTLEFFEGLIKTHVSGLNTPVILF